MPSETAVSRFVTVNGLKLHYLDWGGSGQPMLLIHGMTGNAHSWDSFAPAMKPNFGPIALDQRGHGESQWADSYLSADFASDAAAMIRELGLGKVVTLGLSLGGRTAFVLAARYPELVDKLVIVDIGPVLAIEGIRRIQANRRVTPPELDSLEEAVAFVKEGNPNLPLERIREQVVHNVRQRDDGKWVWKYDPGMTRIIGRAGKEDVWPLLPNIACPTLIMRGADSDILSPEIALRMKEMIPLSQYVEVPNAGHPIPSDNPAGFEAAVKQFLGS